MSAQQNAQPAFQLDSDVYVSYEDQKKINKFARQNAKMEEVKEELKIKQNELKNFEGVYDELILLDDDAQIPYYIGEVFIYEDMNNTQCNLDKMKEKKYAEITELEHKYADLKKVMSELKTELYARFGSRINLEAE